MSRRVFNPPPPKRRIVQRTPLPPEAEALFHMPAEEPPVAKESREEEVVPSHELEDARPDPEPHEAAQRPPDAPTDLESAPPSTATPDWMIDARRVDLLAVAREVGIDIVPRADEPGFAIAPCPACGDATGAAVVLNSRWNTRVWKCPACMSFGGNLDLASLTLMGVRLGELDGEGHGAVQGWFSARGWCDEG